MTKVKFWKREQCLSTSLLSRKLKWGVQKQPDFLVQNTKSLRNVYFQKMVNRWDRNWGQQIENCSQTTIFSPHPLEDFKMLYQRHFGFGDTRHGWGKTDVHVKQAKKQNPYYKQIKNQKTHGKKCICFSDNTELL